MTNSSLEVNDRVLVRNVRLRGKHKLADKWESEVYVVVKRAGDLPVYTVRPLRTLHRDLLLPCGFLPASEVSSPTLTKPTPKPRGVLVLNHLMMTALSLIQRMNILMVGMMPFLSSKQYGSLQFMTSVDQRELRMFL